MNKEEIRLGDIIECGEIYSEYVDVGFGLHNGVKVAEDNWAEFLLIENRNGGLGFSINSRESEVFEKDKWYFIKDLLDILGDDWKKIGNILEFSNHTYNFKEKLERMWDDLENGKYN